MPGKSFADIALADQRPVQLRRSVLFVPGDSLRKITKAAQLDVDSIILDLEDGVAFNRKEEAHRIIVETLGTLDFGRSERLVRINPFSTSASGGLTGLSADDLRLTLAAHPAGYVIPKVETPEQIRIVSDYLDKAENEYGWFHYRTLLRKG